MSEHRDGIHRIPVEGEFRHDVLVGRGLLERTAERVRGCGVAAGARVLVVVDRGAERHAAVVEASLRAAGHACSRVELEATEERKSVEEVEAIWSAALAGRLDRRDLIVAVGGGLVGDVAGFAAASYLRGIRWLAVPTTLLAMVDASTGGKTGINLPQPGSTTGPGGERPLVKNMAGAFWPPIEVLADPITLTTLSKREFASGLAECIKHAVIDGEAHVQRLEELLARLGSPPAIDLVAAVELIAMSVAVKARVVTQDPREQGVRALLNFGHTFGHGVETAPELDITHGEAVGLGMLAAMHAAERVLGFPPAQTQRVLELLRRAGLPTSLEMCLSNLDGTASRRDVSDRTTPSIDSVVERMGFDKKAQAGVVRFVLPRAFGDVEPKVEVEPGVVRRALAAIGCRGPGG